MSKRHPTLPRLWVVSDARNDARLERVLERLPRGSGLIFRLYHLALEERRARFAVLRRLARRRGHLVVLAGDPRQAPEWRADGIYHGPKLLARGPATIRLCTAHSLREIGAAVRARADAVVLSPVFPTRSHPGAKPLGPIRFRLLTARSPLPVIALGGMNARRARRTGGAWAAIDAFATGRTV